jgi:hypothetical protein
MSKKLIIDADTILYSSAAQQQLNKCLATNIEHGSKRMFESKTAFNKWAEHNSRDKNNYSFETVSEIKPGAEVSFAFQSIKQKIDKIVEASGCTEYLVCIEGEGNFRKDYEAKYVDYKGQRSAKPLWFEECREFVVKKYRKNILISEGIETDDSCNMLAWQSYKEALSSRNKDNAPYIIAYCDKDIVANGRGWMLNYNKLEDGVFWNDSFQQSYNFAVQMLIGDSADNIPGIENISKITKERFGIKVEGVGPATAKKILADCKTERDLSQRVFECYSAAHEDDWSERMYENGFFLYLLRERDDKWNLDEYIGTIL